MGTQLPPKKKAKGHNPPNFSAHVYCSQTAVCIGIPLGAEVGFSLGDIVLDEDPAPPPLKEHSPQFSANVCCGQTVGWTKLPLGMDVGLSPGDCVRWRPSSPRKKAQPHPIFRPCLLWSNGSMDQDATWYGGKPRPRRRCVRWGRSSTLIGAQPPVYVYCEQTAGWMKTPLCAEV